MVRVIEANISLFSKGAAAEIREGSLKGSSIVRDQARGKLAH